MLSYHQLLSYSEFPDQEEMALSLTKYTIRTFQQLPPESGQTVYIVLFNIIHATAVKHSMTNPFGFLSEVGFSRLHHFISLTSGLKRPPAVLLVSVVQVVCPGGFVGSQIPNFLSGIK